MEDRRVLSVIAFEDAYFVDAFSSSFFSQQLGVLSNDFDSGGGTVFTQGGTISTDQGGIVEMNSDGSFQYFSPFSSFSVFVDQFTYIASNGSETSPTTTVTIFGGEIPIPFDQPTLIPVLGVEGASDGLAEVNLSSSVGGSLTILDPEDITFVSSENGDAEISFTGTPEDINLGLDTLEYTPPMGFSGFDDLSFDYTILLGGQGGGSQIVTLFVESTGGVSQGVVAVDDEYYVDPAQSTFFASPEAGLLSNDFSTEPESFLFAISEMKSTELGGFVEINFDGSFIYTPPDLPAGEFIDSFTYTVSNELEFASAVATLYVGEVPVPEDVNVRLPLFTVEFLSPQEFVTVQLTSVQGASLTLFNTSGILFESGNNGDSSITFSGLVHDVNFALDSLDYRPPFNFSGDDTLIFEYLAQPSNGNPVMVVKAVSIYVQPIADPPGLSIAPKPVEYLPGVFTPVQIDVTLFDLDGSEIPGFVILESVPQGVIPSVGQQSPIDPQTYFILPGQLDDLAFFVDFAAPESFVINVLATSIERTDEPGEFGGPGGPLLPSEPFEPRFAVAGQTLGFARLPPPETPPPPPSAPPEGVFLLGPLSPPPGPPLGKPGGPKDGSKPVAGVIEFESDSGGDTGGTTVIVSGDGPADFTNDAVTEQQQTTEEDGRSFERSGIYVRKLGGEGLSQIARLPEDLSEDYARFMAFLRTLPNGDYVVYFKRSGQSHEQAAVRQVVVKVRVVNHRLNPDPGEFKPAGEVAEPPKDPNAHPVATEHPESDERAELLPVLPLETPPPPIPETAWTPISASAWLAAITGWKLGTRRDCRVDQMMESFARKPSRRFARRNTTS